MDLQTGDGRSLAGQKVFGELPRSRLCKRACLDSTIRCRTRSPNGKVIRGNHRSRSGNCLAKPMALRARRIFSGLRFAIETRWRSDCPAWLNLVRLLSTAQVTSRSFRELLRRKLRGRNVISYFEAHVANRLGLRDLKYKKDAHGNPLPATGFELTAREWARLGELVLGNGNYHRRQIVPSESIARSVCWFAGKSGVRTHVLVEPAGTERTRGRYGTNARFAVAKRAMVRPLLLQGCACGHGGGAWVALPAPIHYSVVESSDCPPGIGRKLFGRAVSAASSWANGMNRPV